MCFPTPPRQVRGALPSFWPSIATMAEPPPEMETTSIPVKLIGAFGGAALSEGRLGAVFGATAPGRVPAVRSVEADRLASEGGGCRPAVLGKMSNVLPPLPPPPGFPDAAPCGVASPTRVLVGSPD